MDNGNVGTDVKGTKSSLCIYYTVEDVEQLLGVSRGKAYGIIKNLNEELKKKKYVTVAGRVSKVFFQEKYYGLDKMLSTEKGE